MAWKTEKEFEKRDSIIRAIYSTETESVYYIIDNSERKHFNDEGYTVAYFPDRNKLGKVETVSLIDSASELDDAKSILKDKTDPDLID